MPSSWGKDHGRVCAACGLRYDELRTGLTFARARIEIISIGTDRKTGKTKYGRRNGTLGYMHELKGLFFDQHVGECADALADAERLDALDNGTRVEMFVAEATANIEAIRVDARRRANQRAKRLKERKHAEREAQRREADQRARAEARRAADAIKRREVRRGFRPKPSVVARLQGAKGNARAPR